MRSMVNISKCRTITNDLIENLILYIKDDLIDTPIENNVKNLLYDVMTVCAPSSETKLAPDMVKKLVTESFIRSMSKRLKEQRK